MKKTKAIPVFIVAVFSLFACSPGQSADPEPATGALEIDENDRAIEKAYAISEHVTEKSDGLVAVSYVEIPTHQWADGSVHYGVHYNVFVTKRADLLTRSDREKVHEFVAEILKLTTKHIIEPEPPEVLTHMGVQLFDADAWTYGGHIRGDITVFEASRSNLLNVDYDASYRQWLGAAVQNKQVIIPESALNR